jgi:hypothetical protein
VALGQVFSDNFGFPCQSTFHGLLHTRHHLSSAVGTTGQIVADVPSGHSLTPPQKKKKNKQTKNLGCSKEDLGYDEVLTFYNLSYKVKSRRMRWTGHVARMGATRNTCRILVGKPEGKRPLGRTRRRCVGNIKIDVREIG